MDEIMTKTMAEIYIQQGHLQEAYEILKALSDKDPSNIEIKEKLKELSEKLNLSASSIDQPVPSSNGRVCSLMNWLANIQRKKRR